METRPVDVQDDAALARAHEVLVAAQTLDRPWHHPVSLAEAVVGWRHVDVGTRMELWGAVDDSGETVGLAHAWLPLDDNVKKMFVAVAVHPDHRRRGAGRRLVERLVERARAERRDELLVDTLVPPGDDDHPYLRFAEATGFRRTSTELIRRRALPVPTALLDRLAAGAQPREVGRYRLETHRQGVPEPLQESLCAVMNLLAVDAPTGDVEYEAETFTPERYREELRKEREMANDSLTTVAVDVATGDVVAYTDLVLPAAPNPVVWQWGTYVHRDHRGHHLGMAVKVQNLRRLAEVHPERELVVTGNDETNRWMVDINVALGFEVREHCPSFRRVLE